MLKVVFFDAAGTLFDARRPVGESYAQIAHKYGARADAKDVTAAFRRVFNNAPGLSFGPGRGDAELRQLERQWWRNRVKETFAGLAEFTDFDAYFNELFEYFAAPQSWFVHEEVFGALAELRRQGLELGLISNFDGRLYKILAGLGLLEFFHSVSLSSEVGWSKPAPELFTAALAIHQAGPDQAMHVGDSLNLDVAGAQVVGIEAILIRRQAPNVPWGLPASHRPDLTVHSLDEVVAYVRERDRMMRSLGRGSSVQRTA